MQPYDELAPWFDRFMDYYDYEEEAEILYNFMRQEGGDRCHCLDIGVGSGNHLLPLLRWGLKVDGLDCSEAMVEILKEKLAAEGTKSHIFIGDMREFKAERPYDILYSFGDTVHHLGTDEGFEKFLAAANGSLKDGGLLVYAWEEPAYFDDLFANGSFFEEHEENYLLWDMEERIDGSIDLLYTAFLLNSDGSYRKAREVHNVAVYEENFLNEAAERQGFEVCPDLSKDYFAYLCEENPHKRITVLRKRKA